MLCQFSFSNFKSFKKEAFLDLYAESISDNIDSLIVDIRDKEKFLPVIAIYGPNGGGKSTVLEALGYLRAFILQTIIISHIYEKDSKIDLDIKKYSSFKDKYHRFDPDYANKPMSFDIMFRSEGKQFRYQLSILHNEVVEENLYMQIVGEKDAQLLFERSTEECILGEELEGIAVERIKSSMPLLAHIAMNYDINSIDEVIAWFMDMKFVDFDNPKKDRQILIPHSERKQRLIFDMLQKMDIPIIDFRVEKDMDGNIENIYTKHRLENGQVYEILFEEESSGTRKLFSCLAEIIECLYEGNLMIADELDAKLHPKLLQYIIELFTNSESNKRGAQLLLTSHDITTMIPEVFRRDEIWFCARNQENASKLYSLISFRKENGQQPRKDEVYGKQYLEGRYGADPYIRKILDWGNDNEPETIKGQ